MGCKGCLECLLKLLNFLLTLLGLAMMGYGIYLFVEYKNESSNHPHSDNMMPFGRPLLMAVSFSGSIFENLPKAWFIYLFAGLGLTIFLISCFGCIGAATRNGCCLCCYSLLLFLLILVELGVAAFIFFDKSWKEEIPRDKTGDFDMISRFLEKNWKIVKWVALGAVIFETLVFLLALSVRAANKPQDYDSDEEYIGGPRQQLRQQLINNRPPVPVTGVPVAGNLDNRLGRSDAWSTRMREKYGLDTSEFTYNPSESNGNQQATPQQTEEKSWCTIM